MATNSERSEEKKAADRTPDQDPNDKNATDDGDITADAADRFAESIRPSWFEIAPTQTVQADATALEQPSKNSLDVADAVPQSNASREDTDAELKLAAASILPTKGIRKKTLYWAGGAVACLLLITLSVVTQKEQETSLWESNKTTKPADLQKVPKEERAEAQSATTIESESSEEATNESSARAIGSPINRVEEPLAGSEAKGLTESSQAPKQLSSNPIGEKPTQEAEEPQKVRIQVTTVPATAELTLDGSSVPNPFDRLLPKNGKHLFVAKAYGYLKKFRRIAFDRDRTLSLQLELRKQKSRVTRRRATKTESRRKSSIKAPRGEPEPSRATSSAKSSKKGFISENPY